MCGLLRTAYWNGILKWIIASRPLSRTTLKKGGKMVSQRFIFASDIHGDKQDANGVKALLAFSNDFKPHVKICGGDLFDFRPLRRGACQEEKKESMQNDWASGVHFLQSWKPHHLLLGNHDKRLWDLAQTDGVAADFAQKAVTDFGKICHKLRCETRPYHK